MADNIALTEGSGPKKSATREVTYSGESAHVQASALTVLTGSDDAKVVRDVTDDDPYPVKDEGTRGLLLRILQMLMSPMGFDRSLSRQRVTGIIESGTVTTVSTVTTVTTCTTVSSLTNVAAIGGYSAQVQVVGINLTAWAQCMRARIT